ncbi:MAG: PIG-L family deacetylase [Candidatus Omnitrophica bacterium]|nr:PIG-L family deacetylase [Candidatus Omnitrophota bacterium]
MNILAIGAHPDDIEYGCGGTLLKHAAKGDAIYLLVLTDGQEAGDPKMRRKEQEAAAQFLKVKKIFWGEYGDTKLSVTKDLITFIEKVIKKVKPDEIYVNYDDDTHQDHRIVAQCVISATRYVKKVLFYEDYTSCNFEPDIFVDIKDVLEEKINLLKLHESQILREYPTELDMLESVRAIANFRGFQGKIKYAEGFKSLRYLKEI